MENLTVCFDVCNEWKMFSLCYSIFKLRLSIVLYSFADRLIKIPLVLHIYTHFHKCLNDALKTQNPLCMHFCMNPLVYCHKIARISHTRWPLICQFCLHKINMPSNTKKRKIILNILESNDTFLILDFFRQYNVTSDWLVW